MTALLKCRDACITRKGRFLYIDEYTSSKLLLWGRGASRFRCINNDSPYGLAKQVLAECIAMCTISANYVFHRCGHTLWRQKVKFGSRLRTSIRKRLANRILLLEVWTWCGQREYLPADRWLILQRDEWVRLANLSPWYYPLVQPVQYH